MKYRVGRKQSRAILDEKGHEVILVNKGFEYTAQQLCDLLNGEAYEKGFLDGAKQACDDILSKISNHK